MTRLDALCLCGLAACILLGIPLMPLLFAIGGAMLVVIGVAVVVGDRR